MARCRHCLRSGIQRRIQSYRVNLRSAAHPRKNLSTRHPNDRDSRISPANPGLTAQLGQSYPQPAADPARRLKALKFTGPYIPYARVLYMLLCGGGPGEEGAAQKMTILSLWGVYSSNAPPYNPAHR